MAYDAQLAERTRQTLLRTRGIREQKMFGGLCFLLHGNILVGVWRDSLVVRLGLEQAATALFEPDVRPFNITGQAMKGWIVVQPAGCDDDQSLADWIQRAKTFVQKLPKK